MHLQAYAPQLNPLFQVPGDVFAVAEDNGNVYYATHNVVKRVREHYNCSLAPGALLNREETAATAEAGAAVGAIFKPTHHDMDALQVRSDSALTPDVHHWPMVGHASFVPEPRLQAARGSVCA